MRNCCRDKWGPSAGDKVEEKGSETCCKKGYCRIEADQKRNENGGTEGNEHELDAHDGTFDRR